MARSRPWLAAVAVLILGALLVGCPAPEPDHTRWSTYLGDPTSSQYSSLDQIDVGNVHRLEVAWTYESGGASPTGRTQIQCNPLVVDTVLFGTSPRLSIFALHAATGRELWRFDPFGEDEAVNPLGVNRGLAYWTDGDQGRIFVTAGSTLYALDASTGRLIPGFGFGGRVDLHEGLGVGAEDRFVLSNTPGVVFEDLLILGTRVSEGPEAAPGHIRAFDVHDGELRWIFHTIPKPGESGFDTWPPDAHETVGGANAWAGFSLDVERGVVFAPTGSAAFDFYGGNRHGANLFANSILALDARTGRRRWHFQTVHHDLWDRDLPAPPNLLTVERDGRRVEAVAQITKSGFVFLFDRDTGEPLFEIEERPVPASDLDGESAWPTQPFPVRPPPFARQVFTREMITRRSPEAHAAVAARFDEGLRTGEPFIPPSREGTILFPGFDGGGEWGGAAHDPERGILYVNSNEMPWILTMVDVPMAERTRLSSLGRQRYVAACAACHGLDRRGDAVGVYPDLAGIESRSDPEEVRSIIVDGKGVMPSFGHLGPREVEALVAYLFDLETARDTSVGRPLEPPPLPYAHTGYHRFLDPEGYPAVEPPWGTLNAIDLNRGEILWQVPLGEFDALTAAGHPVTGTENYGGPIATGGGLLFIGATKDERFRAFDRASGRVLWETRLPAGGYATPATYEVGGRQYVVIAAGGGKMGTKSGDRYVAFALPDELLTTVD